MLAFSKGRLFSLFCAVLFLFSFWHLRPHLQVDGWPGSPIAVEDDLQTATRRLAAIPETRKNIVIASNFPVHFDVYLALAWTMHRVMSDAAQLHVYAQQPFSYGFQDVINWGLNLGEIRDPQDLIADVIGNVDIDMVVLGTCEVDMWEWNELLLAVWDARDAQHKFKLVCIVHNAATDGWHPDITEWSRRDSIRILTISKHVGKAFRKIFEVEAASPDPVINTAGYEDIPIDVHIPILDVQNLPDHPPNRTLSNVVIQGSFESNRRDHAGIFHDLIEALDDDPVSWGYLPLGSSPSYAYDPDYDRPPLRVHLVGSGYIEVPPKLVNVVLVHQDLNYTDYYNLMGSMDICVPAFNQNNGYFERQASSTASMCLETHVPILLTQRMRDAYTFLDDSRVSIMRPAAMREVAAVHALRIGDASHFLASDPVHSLYTMGAKPRIKHRVEAMLREGWRRSKSDFDVVKHRIWRENDVVVLRLLRDL